MTKPPLPSGLTGESAHGAADAPKTQALADLREIAQRCGSWPTSEASRLREEALGLAGWIAAGRPDDGSDDSDPYIEAGFEALELPRPTPGYAVVHSDDRGHDRYVGCFADMGAARRAIETAAVVDVAVAFPRWPNASAPSLLTDEPLEWVGQFGIYEVVA